MAKEKVKKPLFKRWWVWAVIVIVVVAIFGNIGNNDDSAKSDDQKTAAESTKNDSASDKPKKEEKKVEKKVYNIGDKIKVGDVEYTVLNKKAADKVGPSALPEKATGKFIVLELKIKNDGDEKITVDSSFFKLKRGSKTYEADSQASMSANQGEDGNIDNSFFLQDLNPDLEMKGKIVFDVSAEIANVKDLVLQVQTGAFGTQTGDINLK